PGPLLLLPCVPGPQLAADGHPLQDELRVDGPAAAWVRALLAGHEVLDEGRALRRANGAVFLPGAGGGAAAGGPLLRRAEREALGAEVREGEAARSRAAAEADAARRRATELAHELSAIDHDSSTLAAQQTQWEDALKDRRQALAALESAAREAETRIGEADADLARAEASLDEARGALDAVAEDEHRLELERSEVLGRKQALAARVEAEWRKPLDQLLAQAPEVAGDIDWLRQENERLRSAIDQVGPVNALAVDGRTDEMNRLGSLVCQRGGPVSARHSRRFLFARWFRAPRRADPPSAATAIDRLRQHIARLTSATAQHPPLTAPALSEHSEEPTRLEVLMPQRDELAAARNSRRVIASECSSTASAFTG